MLSTAINYYPRMVPEVTYHLYNRGNNRGDVFFLDKNYPYFLDKYRRYIAPFFQTFAYCLIPNHFHFLARMASLEVFLNSEEFIRRHAKDFPEISLLEGLMHLNRFDHPRAYLHKDSLMETTLNHSISTFISEQFRRFFMAYAKSINKQESRVGSLFQKNFKRVVVKNESHFTNSVLYLHTNPTLHCPHDDFIIYPYSSYREYLTESESFLARQEVLRLFGGKQGFIDRHKLYLSAKDACLMDLEDD